MNRDPSTGIIAGTMKGYNVGRITPSQWWWRAWNGPRVLDGVTRTEAEALSACRIAQQQLERKSR